MLEEFANGIREGTGCELVAKKSKMFSIDEGAREDCMARDHIPEGLPAIEKGLIDDADGRRLRGITIFNVPIGEPE